MMMMQASGVEVVRVVAVRNPRVADGQAHEVDVTLGAATPLHV